jgi:hypothetical protein
MDKTLERTIENYKAQLKSLQDNINKAKNHTHANLSIVPIESIFRDFVKITGITEEQLKFDFNTTTALALELRGVNDGLISLNSISDTYSFITHFNANKNKLEQAYNAFISGIELRQRINDYNTAFIDKIRFLNKRRKSNIKRVKIFGVLAVILLWFLILLAVCNFPFSSHAQKIIDIISSLNNGGVKINHSLIYFLPKLLYVSCLLFLINICYNNYSFHKNLANLYRDKMDMANQLLALLEARQDAKERETILNKMLEILTKDREFGVKNYGTGLNVNSTLPITLTPNAKS